jgi:ubiquinone/menaquinone biosynthesis C-methylase UbiE
MSAMGVFAKKIASNYDETTLGLKNKYVAEFYADTEFLNYGVWGEDTKDVGEACENLMEELLSFIPEKTGNILDVACGKGATTRYLLNYFEPSGVVGINISEKQLEICEQNAPQCKFLLMDATSLQFEDGSFNNIICVEAAHHFDTREKFLREAHRVLVSGGTLVLSDIRTKQQSTSAPPGNYTASLSEYKTLYETVGFKSVKIVDVTESVRGGLADHFVKFLRRKLQNKEIDPKKFARFMWIYKRYRPTIRGAQNYLLVKATK